MGIYLPGTEILGWGGLMWGWDSLLLRYPSLIFIYHMWVRDQPILHLCLSSPFGWMWFLLFCSCQTSFNSIYDSSEWWFYILVVILLWLFEEARHVCLYRHLDWTSPFGLIRAAWSLTYIHASFRGQPDIWAEFIVYMLEIQILGFQSWK